MKIHGCTVHFVVAEVDSGPIVAQAALGVRDDDTAQTLGARVLALEHALYPWALRLVASGEAEIDGSRVRMRRARDPESIALIAPAPDVKTM